MHTHEPQTRTDPALRFLLRFFGTSSLLALIFVVAPASERVAHIIGIRLADQSRIPKVMKSLGERQVRVSQRGQSIRISPHVYNTSEDMDALMDGLTAGLKQG